MSTTNEFNEDEYYEDLVENSPRESCPMCSNSYDDADFDFQICHKCKWDCNENKYTDQ